MPVKVTPPPASLVPLPILADGEAEGSVVVAGQERGSEFGLGAVVALRTVLALAARASVAAVGSLPRSLSSWRERNFRVLALVGASCRNFVVTFSDQPNPDTVAPAFRTHRQPAWFAQRQHRRGRRAARPRRLAQPSFRPWLSPQPPIRLSHAKAQRRKDAKEESRQEIRLLRDLRVNQTKGPASLRGLPCSSD